MRHFVGIAFLRPWVKNGVLFLAFQLGAQDIPVGTWRTHFSYKNARLLEKTKDKVFCVVQNGLFSIDISEGSKRKLSKIDGLSDVGVSSMKYNPDLNVLALGYRSGFVDLIFENTIISISEIANSNLEGDKQVNGIAFFGSQVYLATDLGIVAADISTGEIRESFVQIGIGGVEETASDLEIINGVLFAKTGSGIQSGDLTSNLLDFNNWTRYTATIALEDLTSLGNDIFALSDLDLFQLSNNLWVDTGVDLPLGSNGLYSSEDQLLTATDQFIFRFSGTQFENVATITSTMVNELAIVSDEYWVADETLGLISESGANLSPNGPLSDEYSRLEILNNTTYGFHAPEVNTYDGTQKVDGYSVFANGEWAIEEIQDFQNISDVAQFQGGFYFSSIGDGLYIQSNGEIISDIPLSDAELDTVLTAIESEQNLWLSSFSNQNPVHRFDGEAWTSYTSGDLLGNEFLDLSLSESGILWARSAAGFIVTFDSEQMRVSVLSGLPGTALDIELSIEDDAWVATSDGLANFSDASFIFENSEVVLPSFENGILFEDEILNAIETDGGNRVWFATDRGLWIFDANISEQVSLFTFKNSPIPSDKILDLAYNGKNGEMFVLTDKGLVSFRSASSVGTNTHQKVNIFPNPVRADYTGLVGIEGLAKNVSIKITDIHGNLVSEFNANGGSASWDLRNVRSAEVVTGIYLFFSSTEDGLETYVGKIAVVR